MASLTPTLRSWQKLAPVLCLALLAPACSDSHDKVMKDQIEMMNEVSSILEKVADGSLSSEKAAKKFAAWKEKGQALEKRKAALDSDPSSAEVGELVDKYQDQALEATTRMMNSMQKVHASGRLTPELGKAVSDFGL
jgi:hypothetical protein